MDNQRNYQAMFILNSRNQEETPEQITNDLKGVIESIGGKVTTENELGRIDFHRVTDRKEPSGHYSAISFSGPANTNQALKEKLRLDKRVKRIIVFSADDAGVAL